MTSKQEVLQVLGEMTFINSSKDIISKIHIKVVNPQKTFDALKIDAEKMSNDHSIQTQLFQYFYYNSIWGRINNIVNTKNKEANDRLEKDYGVRVVFPYED
ncbi:hypothetical protein HMPREF0497_2893 [Lentilactobacillus buchneri ATCC 11577]|nr:hypothetical protein HMPREF0497_2893 [Lentilactobacillus buchneri ATCC 11577]